MVTVCERCGLDYSGDRTTITPGYGVHTRADGVEEKHCFTCCAVADVKSMRETGRAWLYLTSEETAPGYSDRGGCTWGPRRVWYATNWPGSLRFKVGIPKKGRHNMAGVRYDTWFIAFGRTWHGVQYGDNTQILHCRAAKGRAS